MELSAYVSTMVRPAPSDASLTDSVSSANPSNTHGSTCKTDRFVCERLKTSICRVYAECTLQADRAHPRLPAAIGPRSEYVPSSPLRLALAP
eukprot:9484648-Pyramimonas_sp.AAC.1